MADDDVIDYVVTVIYAEHFNMPNNICNTPLLRHASKRKIEKYLRKAESKMNRVCNDIQRGIVRKRGFSRFAQILGNIQGKAWQGDSKTPDSNAGLEHKAQKDVKIHSQCTACDLCVKICPLKNLVNQNAKIVPLDNCTVCYRCVNRCPQKAITVLYHRKPKRQYKGIDQ